MTTMHDPEALLGAFNEASTPRSGTETMGRFLGMLGAIHGNDAGQKVWENRDRNRLEEQKNKQALMRLMVDSRLKTEKLAQDALKHEHLQEYRSATLAQARKKYEARVSGDGRGTAGTGQGKVTATERLKTKDIVTAAGELAKLAHTAEQADKVFSGLETGGTTAQVISNPRALSMIPGNSAQKEYALADKLTSDLVTKHGQQMKGVRALGIYSMIERGKPSIKNPKDTNKEIFSNYRSAMAEDAETLLAHADDAFERGLLSEGEYNLVRKRCAPLMGGNAEDFRAEKKKAPAEESRASAPVEDDGGPDEDEDEERERLELLRQDPRIKALLEQNS